MATLSTTHVVDMALYDLMSQSAHASARGWYSNPALPARRNALNLEGVSLCVSRGPPEGPPPGRAPGRCIVPPFPNQKWGDIVSGMTRDVFVYAPLRPARPGIGWLFVSSKKRKQTTRRWEGIFKWRFFIKLPCERKKSTEVVFKQIKQLLFPEGHRDDVWGGE